MSGFYDAVEAATLAYHTNAFWDVVDERIAFLNELWANERIHEANTLCAVYLDGMASSLGLHRENGGAFCLALIDQERSEAPYFSLIHPLQMIRAVERMKPTKWGPHTAALKRLFPGPDYELLSEPDFLQRVQGSLTPQQLIDLKPLQYRGTIAAIVYEWIRNPFIHELGGSTKILFSNTKFSGQEVEPISFESLREALPRMSQAARANALAKRVIL